MLVEYLNGLALGCLTGSLAWPEGGLDQPLASSKSSLTA